MASEYLKWKYRDIQPEQPTQYTKQQKRANWWHYHKWHVALAIVLGVAVLDIGRSALHIGAVRPDYQFAYVASSALPEDATTAFEKAVATLGEDLNGDGVVTVQLNQYVSGTEDTEASSTATNGDSAYYAYAAGVTLMADLEDCDSFFFLLEDYETFQTNYDVLCNVDGTEPSKWSVDTTNLAIPWTETALSDLALGSYTETIAGTEVSGAAEDLFANLHLARRGFWGKQTCENLQGCEELWKCLVKN